MHSKDARKLLPPVTEAQKLIDNLYDEAADALSDLGDPEWGKVILEGIQDTKKRVINSILSEPEFPDMTPVEVDERIHEAGDVPIGTLFEITRDCVLKGAIVALCFRIDTNCFDAQLKRLPDTDLFRQHSTTYYLGKFLRVGFAECRPLGAKTL